MTITQSRISAGVPTGGQFGAVTHPEASVALDVPVVTEPTRKTGPTSSSLRPRLSPAQRERTREISRAVGAGGSAATVRELVPHVDEATFAKAYDEMVYADRRYEMFCDDGADLAYEQGPDCIVDQDDFRVVEPTGEGGVDFDSYGQAIADAWSQVGTEHAEQLVLADEAAASAAA